ncbi:MAG: hypothetical protein CM15mP105_2210 [Methanobacteriota archaeon]|nr:MAG: hypothetical protein CM15mP105_2210 [Euryarchaeota archaeon]
MSVESLSRCNRGNGVVSYFYRLRDHPLQAPVAILLTACNSNEGPVHEDLDGMAVQPTVLEIVLDGTETVISSPTAIGPISSMVTETGAKTVNTTVELDGRMKSSPRNSTPMIMGPSGIRWNWH